MKTWLKKNRFRLLVTALCVYCIVILSLYSKYLLQMPGKVETLTDIADVASDEQGKLYLINDGGNRLLVIDQNREIMARVDADTSAGMVSRNLDVTADSEGNIFVHNRVASEKAYSWIGEERILEYDSEGNFIAERQTIKYPEPRLSVSILGLETVEGEACFFYIEGDNLYLKRMDGDIICALAYEDADVMITSAARDRNTGNIYICTLDGRIEVYAEGAWETLYDVEAQGDNAIPREIEVSADGTVYVADIGRRGVFVLEDGSYRPYIFDGAYAEGEIDFSAVRIAEQLPPYQLDAGGCLVVNLVDSIMVEEADALRLYDSFSYESEIDRICRLVLAAELIAVVLAAYGALCVMRAIVRSKSELVRSIAAVVVGIIGVTALFCALAMSDFTERLTREMVARETMAAELVNRLMPKDAFRNLRGVKDYRSEDYMEVKKIVDSVILDHGTTAGDLYLVIYSLEEEGLILRYALEEVQGCWYPYIWSDGTDEQFIYDHAEVQVFSGEKDSEGSFLLIYAPLTDDEGEVIGVIEVGTDLTVFSQENRSLLFELFVNILVIAVVVILLVLEGMVFISARKRYMVQKRQNQGDGRQVPLPVDMLRVVVFLVFFVTNLTTPFLSIYGLQLAEKMDMLWGISPEIWAAVPISAEVLFGALFSVLGNGIIRRLGRRWSGILGGVLFTSGLILRFLLPDLLVLTAGNALQGAGWGIVLLIINAELAGRETEEEKEAGFTGYNIALQNGMNSGIVSGGFLLLFLDYTGIMASAAVISVIVLFFCVACLPKGKDGQEKEEKGQVSMLRFFFRRKVLAYYLCVVIPVIAASYYLNYLYPILAERAGMEENYIGYSYLLNGLVIICFGNLIVNFMSKRFNRRILILIAGAVYTVCFVMVGLFQNIPVLLVVLILLAVSDSFGYVAQSTFYNDLKEVEEYGHDRAAGVYSLMENASQTAGSFLFGYVLSAGLREGMILYGIVILAGGGLFVAATADFKKKIRKKKHRKEGVCNEKYQE